MSEPWQLEARTLAEKVRARELSALEVAETHIERTLHQNDALEAFLHFEPEDIRRQARAIDRRIDAGQDPGPLAGVPVALKDNICVRGQPTTCGSRLLEPFEPPYDAFVVERLRGAGAVLFGKTNLDEFGMGSSTENSAFAPARNPYDLERTPGGSSGGSAAAVAAGLAPLAIGSDTGGSIRQPAAFCGIVGVKPTYGLVSRSGLVAFASSLDQIGPLARDVDDAALLLQTIAGHDAHDATSSVARAPDLLNGAGNGSLRGMRIGIPVEFFEDGLAQEVRVAVGAAATSLARDGAEVEEIRLPLSRHAIAVYYVVAPCEASSNLARYDGVRFGLRGEGDGAAELVASGRGEGFGREVKRRILLGTFSLSHGYYEAYYGRAQRVRAALRREVETALEGCDALLTPTTPTVAFRLGEKSEDCLSMYQCDVLTVIANLCGLPALSLPCGRTQDGMPIGMQLMTRRFGEETLFRVARAYQRQSRRGHEWPPEPEA